ncbi:MAG: Methyltransferase type 11 [Verrucomicrobiales bacterium]|nr:Methyltransferase type 11 [Verrucomicrobiales bacterium]
MSESFEVSNNESAEVRSNRELWNNLSSVHPSSAFYDVPRFLTGQSALNCIEQELLGDITGKTILHLQCHFGLGTLSMARMGAIVTGVDFSEVAIQKARELNGQLKLKANFVEQDVNRLDEVLQGEFDIVFASFGIIGWHKDLARWARIVSHFLKADGKFVFAEFHPTFWMLSEDHSRVAYSYFQADAIVEENQKSYAAPEAGVLGTSYCWNHGLAEVFQALEQEGLTVMNFREYDFSPYPIFQATTEKEGRYYIQGMEHLVPLVYSLTARKNKTQGTPRLKENGP